MAASEERAERIATLKAERPDMTWDRIADAIGVKERSAIEWQRTGGITYDNCAKLAGLFEVDPEWLWSGRERPDGTGDPFQAPKPTPDIAAELRAQRALQEALLAEMQELRRLLSQGPPPASSPTEDQANGPPEALLARSPRTQRIAPPIPE
jgi:hypothetical protein